MALATEKWWDANTVAVVTGSNKGIGFEAARMLAEVRTEERRARGAGRGHARPQGMSAMVVRRPGCK